MIEIEQVYISDQQNAEIEIAYTSAQKTTKSKKFTLLPKYKNVERLRENICLLFIFQMTMFWWLKGKHIFAIFQVLASILGFYALGVDHPFH